MIKKVNTRVLCSFFFFLYLNYTKWYITSDIVIAIEIVTGTVTVTVTVTVIAIVIVIVIVGCYCLKRNP